MHLYRMAPVFLCVLAYAAPQPIYAASSSTEESPGTSRSIYTRLSTTTPVEPADRILEFLTSISPRTEAASPIIGAIDQGRVVLSVFLQKQIVAAVPHLPGNVLLTPDAGKHIASSGQFDWQKVWSSLLGLMWTLYFFLLVLISYTTASMVISYALLVLALVFAVFKLYRFIRKRR